MFGSMRALSLMLVAAAALCGAQPDNTLTPQEVQDGWILLFDGTSTFGWTVEGAGQWHVSEGALAGDAGGDGWLRHNTAFGDYVLRIEFRAPTAETNSGIFFRSATTGEPHKTGFELQIWDKNEKFPTGSLVNFAGTKEGRLRPGEWQIFRARGGRRRLHGDGSTARRFSKRGTGTAWRGMSDCSTRRTTGSSFATSS